MCYKMELCSLVKCGYNSALVCSSGTNNTQSNYNNFFPIGMCWHGELESSDCVGKVPIITLPDVS